MLDLSGNSVSDGSAAVLVSSLRLNPGLELLMLRDNPLGQCGARILLRALATGAGGCPGGAGLATGAAVDPMSNVQCHDEGCSLQCRLRGFLLHGSRQMRGGRGPIHV